ncbi:hypothetical protein HYX02_03820 [Candidatus Woesearchaeota archaeon]|nr:hypothetical protein [Candidatus Woesearchaeota archaeon]
MNINPKAQSWSIDIALGVVVFIAAFFIFYTLLSPNQSAKASNLKEEASSVIKQVASEEAPLSFVDGEEVNVSKLNELKNLSYGELSRRLRVEGDFCIYFEDEHGNIIIINDSYKGIGSPNINLSGTPCSQK